MRKSFLAAGALAAFLIPAGLANAGCYGPECGGETPDYNSSYNSYLAGGKTGHTSSSVIYGKTPVYSSGSSVTYRSSSSSPCPSGSTKSADGVCIVSGSGTTTSRVINNSWSGTTQSSHAGHNHYSHSAHTNKTSSVSVYESGRKYYAPTSSSTISSVSSYTPSYSYSSGSYSSAYGSGYSSNYVSGRTTSTMSAPCPAGSRREGGICLANSSGTIYSGSTSTVSIVPFSEPVIRAGRLLGLGDNETLLPTSCPTSVYNPQGAKVLGCYTVNKPVVRQVYVQPQIHTVRVVRPVIYVRYPVPTPVAVPVMTRTCANVWTRYGERWPGRTCGW